MDEDTLQLLLQGLAESGYSYALSVLQQEANCQYDPNRFPPAELSRRLAGSASATKSATLGQAENPELSLLSPGEDDYVQQQIRCLDSFHAGNVTCVRWAPDGRLISGSADRSFCVSTGALGDSPESVRVAANAAILSLDVHPVSNLLLVSTMDGSVMLYSIAAAKPLLLQNWRNHIKYVNSVRWQPYSSQPLFASCSFDESVHVYRPAESAEVAGSYELLQRLQCGGVVEAICWANSGTALAAAVRGEYRLHIFTGGALERRTLNLNENGDERHSFTILALDASPDDRWLAAHADVGFVIILCLKTGKQMRRLYGPKGDGFNRPVQAWHPSGKYFYTSNAEAAGPLLVWDVASERIKTELRGHTALVRDMHNHPSMNVLASCGFDRTIRIWAAAEKGPVSQDASMDVLVDGLVQAST
uniref:Uncharacterized protein n=1 Tax=Chrysotila carterae TaxID=13221 RepID=A0A7S4FC46_CHRCT